MAPKRLAFIALTCGLLTLAGVTLYQNRLINQTSAYLLEAKDAQIGLRDLKLSQISEDLAQKKADLDKKQTELDKASSDLVSKLKELDSAQKKIKSQEAQISTNSAELTKLRNRPPLFSFRVDATNLAEAEAKKNAVRQVVTDAYDAIIDVAGQPYLLHEVTIQFVDSFSIPTAAAETEITNTSQGLSVTIRLKDFDRNSFGDVNGLIHELSHTFDGLAYLNPIAYTEGKAVATADAVMEKMITAGTIPSFKPLYVRISAHEYSTTNLTLPSDDALFYSSGDVAKYYQIVGYGWLQLYRSDNGFFKSFNDKLFAQKRNGIEITGSMVKDLIKQSISQVNNAPIDSWLETKAFALQ